MIFSNFLPYIDNHICIKEQISASSFQDFLTIFYDARTMSKIIPNIISVQ